jgi:hypothetical protein
MVAFVDDNNASGAAMKPPGEGFSCGRIYQPRSIRQLPV